MIDDDVFEDFKRHVESYPRLSEFWWLLRRTDRGFSLYVSDPTRAPQRMVGAAELREALLAAYEDAGARERRRLNPTYDDGRNCRGTLAFPVHHVRARLGLGRRATGALLKKWVNVERVGGMSWVLVDARYHDFVESAASERVERTPVA